MQIPLFIHESIQCLEEHGLDTEGILRVPGAAVRIKVCGGVAKSGHGGCVSVSVFVSVSFWCVPLNGST